MLIANGAGGEIRAFIPSMVAVLSLEAATEIKYVDAIATMRVDAKIIVF